MRWFFNLFLLINLSFVYVTDSSGVPVWSNSVDDPSSEESLPFVGHSADDLSSEQSLSFVGHSADNLSSEESLPFVGHSADNLSSEESLPFVGHSADDLSSEQSLSFVGHSAEDLTSEDSLPFVDGTSRAVVTNLSSISLTSKPHRQSVVSPQRKPSVAFPPNRFCLELTNGFYRHPTNCSRIIQCFNKKIFEYPPCRHGLVFNERIGFCDYLRTSRC